MMMIVMMMIVVAARGGVVIAGDLLRRLRLESIVNGVGGPGGIRAA